MIKFLVCGAAAAAIIAGGAAVAQTATRAAGARHMRAAHPMTRAEVQARAAAMFARLDTNHDGFVTKEEIGALQAQREQKAEQRAARFDPSKMFDRLDSNHDGQLTAAEVNAAPGRRAQALAGQAAPARSSRFARLFGRADANKDGVITRAEFDALGRQMKARMEHASLAHGGMARHDGNDSRCPQAEMQTDTASQRLPTACSEAGRE